MMIQCCVCKKVKTGSSWAGVPNPEVVAAHASHGYCPTCAAAAFAEIEQIAAARKLVRAHAMHA
ncbi:MAG: hypothetical protein HZB26_09210 [Candidatus Hydrogenedentes bacterium]|nr:hypothetical protein [Candidatus Hydrogenedentota bacterium]